MAQLYSPPAQPTGNPPATLRNPSRSLGHAFANMLPAPPVPVIKKFDPLSATILTAQGRTEASPEFLNCCRLLTHHDPTIILTDTQMGHQLSTQANLFPRQPTLHFRRDVLNPTTVVNGGYITNF